MYKFPLWAETYTIKACDYLKLKRENLILKRVTSPSGNQTWRGSYTPQGPKAVIEIRYDMKNTREWRKVILHELVHHKMKDFDYFIENKIIDDYGLSEVITEEYLNKLEIVVKHFTTILFDGVEKHAVKKP